jgi:hypothetical protein
VDASLISVFVIYYLPFFKGPQVSS